MHALVNLILEFYRYGQKKICKKCWNYGCHGIHGYV